MRPRISRFVRASPRTSAHAAQQEDGRLDAALDERARDDEAVAAVVAAPAQHAHVARREVLERRLHRRDRLASGVSISTIDGMPMSSIVRRSASRIC